MNLAETQAAFFALTFGEPASVSWPLRLSGPAAVMPEPRLRVYRDANVRRNAITLRSTFPGTAVLLGPDGFLDAARAYVEHSGRTAETHEPLAAGFPESLRGRTARADVADLAALEWARSEVLQAPQVAAMGRDSLAHRDVEELMRTRLSFVPAMRLVALASDVAPLWDALVRNVEPPAPVLEPTSFLVWRRTARVVHAPVDACEARALARATAGAPLAEVCGAFRDEPDPARRAYTALGSWIDDGLVMSVEECGGLP